MSEIIQIQARAVSDLSYCGWSTSEIAAFLRLTQRRVQQILKENETEKQNIRTQFSDFNGHCKKLA